MVAVADGSLVEALREPQLADNLDKLEATARVWERALLRHATRQEEIQVQTEDAHVDEGRAGHQGVQRQRCSLPYASLKGKPFVFFFE